MVNRFLSSMSILLDSCGGKSLRTNEPQTSMVGRELCQFLAAETTYAKVRAKKAI